MTLHIAACTAAGPPEWDSEARRALAPVEREVGGIRMILHPQDNWTEFKLWRDGAPPEPLSLARVMRLVAGRRALIFDIGANCGSYALALSAVMGAGSRLLAFEPNPVMAGRLRANLALNGLQAEVHQCALGPADGNATLTLHPQNFGQATLRATDAGVAGQVEVAMRPLAVFVPDGRFDTFVIKIDVEGFEDQVLRPYFASAARRPDHILLEVEHAGQWSHDLRTDLLETGYAPVFVGEGNALMQRKV